MKRIEDMVNKAVREGISDIHIAVDHAVVLRKSGKILFGDDALWSRRDVEDLVRGLLTKAQMEMLLSRKSVDIAHSVGLARLRINIFSTLRGLSLAIRLLPTSIPTIQGLNLHPSLHDIAPVTSGLVIVCGATGVGKTTTIAAIINDINSTRQAHIVTLENPIEYRFQSKKSFVQQRELGTHVPSFAQGLLDVLRENPDVIVVGELREPETMRLTLSAALSGHLVIATMHASSPEEAIYRLCNSVPLEVQYEIRHQLAHCLHMIITQQLVHWPKAGFQLPLLSILRGTKSIKNIIRENKLNQIPNAMEMSRSEGMFTSQRYLEEYLATRTSFFPYKKTQSPSAVRTVPADTRQSQPDRGLFNTTTTAPAAPAPNRKAPPARPESPFQQVGVSYSETFSPVSDEFMDIQPTWSGDAVLTIEENGNLAEFIESLKRTDTEDR